MEAELFQKHKSSYFSAAVDLKGHVASFATSSYLLWLWKDSWFCVFPILTQMFMLGRTFMVFHDCVHNSYSPSRPLNWALGHVAGILTLTSPNWFLDHDTHHKTTGNIENKQHYSFNETIASTKNIPRFYAWFRHPLVFFSAVPVLYFGILQRFTYILKKLRRPDKFEKSLSLIVLDHAINNVGVYFYLNFVYRIGLLPVYCVSLFLFASMSFMTFHNQHSFNPPYVVNNETWSQRNSGLLGSSFIQVPFFLKYFYMGIEYHHIHHLNSRIPGYHLQAYHEEMVEKSDLFDNVVKLSPMDCYRNLSLTLYDEKKGKYI
jgi:omega-6 fatty acid desaturase (delta-12 desaturase)